MDHFSVVAVTDASVGRRSSPIADFLGGLIAVASSANAVDRFSSQVKHHPPWNELCCALFHNDTYFIPHSYKPSPRISKKTFLRTS